MNAMDGRVVSLFAGMGGLSLGFQQAGFNVAAAFDNWPAATSCYRQNFPGHPCGFLDLGDQHAAQIVRIADPYILIGGPPCQDFSSAGKRVEGEQAALTVSFAKIVDTARPMFFVMENVPAAASSEAWNTACDLLREKYALSIAVLDSSFYGVPQIRKRLFVVGQRDEFQSVESLIDLSAGAAERHLTIRQEMPDIDIDHYYRHPRSYKRRAVFSVDEPSPTIRGVNRPVAPNYPGHAGDTAPVETVRPLTTVERLRIQTFPATWNLPTSTTTAEQLIGNAVPPQMARHIAIKIRERIELWPR